MAAESDGEDVPLRTLASRYVVPQVIGARPVVVSESFSGDEEEEDVPLRVLATGGRPRKRACREPPAPAATPRADIAPDARASALTIMPLGASASQPAFAVGRPVRRAAASGEEARRSAGVRRGAAFAHFAAVRRVAADSEEADEHECEFVGSCGLDAALEQRQAAAEAANAVVTLD